MQHSKSARKNRERERKEGGEGERYKKWEWKGKCVNPELTLSCSLSEREESRVEGKGTVVEIVWIESKIS